MNVRHSFVSAARRATDGGHPAALWLDESPVAPYRAGGKGHGLSLLASWGKPTPNALCLTTDAFHAYFAENGLAEARAELEAELPSEAARAGLQELCWEEELPEGLTAAVEAALPRLSGRDSEARLAVRSSGADEDGRQASFAGQHETVLHLPLDGWEDAVRTCWASLWAPLAVMYRARRALPLHDLSMAVVVQRMLDAEASAIVFTRHPVSGDDDVSLVVGPRYGERLVGGHGTPRTVVVDRATLEIAEDTPGDDGDVVSDAELRELAAEALDIEERLGAPADIECSREHGQWQFLQVRPITT